MIRSKNAGPFMLTFDLIFKNAELYRRAKAAKVLTRKSIAKLYGRSENEVSVFECDNINAIKFSFPRPIIQGDLADADGYGGQQYVPVLDLET